MGIADILLHSSWFLFRFQFQKFIQNGWKRQYELDKHIIISKKTSKFDLPVHWELKQSEYLKNPPSRCSQSKFPVYFLFECKNWWQIFISEFIAVYLFWCSYDSDRRTCRSSICSARKAIPISRRMILVATRNIFG